MKQTAPLACPVRRVQDARREKRIGYRLLISINDVEIPSTNISLSGAQLCCPMMRYKSLALNTADALAVSWVLPGTSTVIACCASLRYSNLCEDEYLIGLEFAGFTDEASKIWSKFVSALIAEREAINI